MADRKSEPEVVAVATGQGGAPDQRHASGGIVSKLTSRSGAMALGWRPPAPESDIPLDQRPVMHGQSTWTVQPELIIGTCRSPQP